MILSPCVPTPEFVTEPSQILGAPILTGPTSVSILYIASLSTRSTPGSFDKASASSGVTLTAIPLRLYLNLSTTRRLFATLVARVINSLCLPLRKEV